MLNIYWVLLLFPPSFCCRCPNPALTVEIISQRIWNWPFSLVILLSIHLVIWKSINFSDIQSCDCVWFVLPVYLGYWGGSSSGEKNLYTSFVISVHRSGFSFLYVFFPSVRMCMCLCMFVHVCSGRFKN